MIFDDALHRLGAGVGRPLADQSRAGAEGETGRAAQGREQGWADAPLCKQTFEAFQMPGFVGFHYLELSGDGASSTGFQDRPLPTVDPHRSQFARMIDAKNLRQPLLLPAGSGPWGRRPRAQRLAPGRAARALATAAAKEMIAFQPAIDSRRNTQAG